MRSSALTCSNGDCHVSSETLRWSNVNCNGSSYKDSRRLKGQKTGETGGSLYFDQTIEMSLDDTSESFLPSASISAACATSYSSIPIPPQKGLSSNSIETSSSVATSKGSFAVPECHEQHQSEVDAELKEINNFLTRLKGLEFCHKMGKSCGSLSEETTRVVQNIPASKYRDCNSKKAATLIFSKSFYLRHSLGTWRQRASTRRRESHRLHDMNNIAVHFFLKHSCRHALNYWMKHLELSKKARGIVGALKNVKCLQQASSLLPQSLKLRHLMLRILKSWRQSSCIRRVMYHQLVREAWYKWSCFAASATCVSEALELFESLHLSTTCKSVFNIWMTEVTRVGVHLMEEEKLLLTAARHHSLIMKRATLGMWKRGVDITIFISYRKAVRRCLALRRWSDHSSALQNCHKRLREASNSLKMLKFRRSLSMWKEIVVMRSRMKISLAVYHVKLLQKGIAADGWYRRSRCRSFPHQQKHALLRAHGHRVWVSQFFFHTHGSYSSIQAAMGITLEEVR